MDTNCNTFQNEMELILKNIRWLISTTYDCTNQNQQICFVLNRNRSYKVSIYAENLQKSSFESRCILICQSEYELLTNANDYIKEIQQDYLKNASMFYQQNVSKKKFELLVDLIEIDDKCKLTPDKYLQPGDHICISYDNYQYDAIYVGNKKVIHDASIGRSSLAPIITKCSMPLTSIATALVSTSGLAAAVNLTVTADRLLVYETDWAKFVDESIVSRISIIHYKIRVFSPNEIVERARDSLKNDDTVSKKRCQCFASHCVTNVEHLDEIFKRRQICLPPCEGIKTQSSVTEMSVDDAIHRAQNEQKATHCPHIRIIIVGASGVGKSTLINALFQADVCAEGIGAPVTMEIEEYPKINDNDKRYAGPLRLVDTRGYEARGYDVVKAVKRYIKAHNNDVDYSHHVHIALICINAETKRYVSTDVEFAQLFARFRIPTVIVLTRCYDDTQEFVYEIKSKFSGVEPSRLIESIRSHWPYARSERDQLTQMLETKYLENGGENQRIYNIAEIKQLIDCVHKSDEGTKKCKIYDEFIEKVCKLFPSLIVVPIVARSKSFNIDSDAMLMQSSSVSARGLNELNFAIIDLLDEAQMNAYVTAQRVDINLKVRRAHIVLVSFSTAAGGIGSFPIPLTDALALVPLEVAMLTAITPIFHVQLSEGVLHAIATAAVKSAIGHTISTGVLKLIPIYGSVLGAVTAAALTYELGHAYIAALADLVSERKKNDPPPTIDDIENAMRAYEYGLRSSMKTDTNSVRNGNEKN